MLTTKQDELFQFLKKQMAGSNVSPSFLEMKEAIGAKSKSSVFQLLKNLEDRGFIRRIPRKSRAIEIIKKD
jgi:repressor LexA